MEELGAGEAKAFIRAEVDDSGVSVVELSGELDVSNVSQAHEVITDLIQNDSQHLVFDLVGITFMDSSGLGLLVFARREAKSVKIRQASPIARRVIEATGLAEYLGLGSDGG